MRIGASTLGFLHQRTLEESLESIARAGYRAVDLSPTAPHLYLPEFGPYARRRLQASFERLGLECASINPTELNLVSTNPGYAELSRHHLELCLELARDLGADTVAFAPGRLFVLNPAPIDDVLAVLVAALEQLVEAAERYGVVLAVETVPFGFMQTGAEVAEVVDRVGSPWLRATYDIANTLANEDAATGLTALGGERLRATHISGSWRDRWAHDRVVDSDVDVSAYADALRAVGYDGVTIYELIDGADPEDRMREDLALFADNGWEV